MLVLKRNAGEAIRINDDVVVTVLGVAGGQVKVGVSAPRTTPVHRQEIYDRIQAEKSAENALSASIDCHA